MVLIHPKTIPLSSDLSGQFFYAIYNNDHEKLKQLLEAHDPNLAYFSQDSLLNVANYLGGREDCYKILVDHGADEEFAKKLALTKQFGHIVNLGGEINTVVNLRNNSAVPVKLTADLSSPLAGVQWAKKNFSQYATQTNDADFKALADAFEFTANPKHFIAGSLNDSAEFLKRVKQDDDSVTVIPSGYEKHNVGILIYKDKLIVSDGSENIAIYSIAKSAITKQQIEALLSANTEAEFKSVISDMSKGKSPELFAYKKQSVNNCCYRNFVSAAEGLCYVKSCEKMNNNAATVTAKQKRSEFNKFDKGQIVAETKKFLTSNPENKELCMQLLGKYLDKLEKKQKVTENLAEPINKYTKNAAIRINQLLDALPQDEKMAFCKQHHVQLLKFENKEIFQDLLAKSATYAPQQQAQKIASHFNQTRILTVEQANLAVIANFTSNQLDKLNIDSVTATGPKDNPLKLHLKINNEHKTQTHDVYISKNEQNEVSYALRKISPSETKFAIESVCALAVASSGPGAHIDLSKTPPDKLLVVYEALDKAIKASSLPQEKRPQIIVDSERLLAAKAQHKADNGDNKENKRPGTNRQT